MKKGFIFVAVLALLAVLAPGCAPEGAPTPTVEGGIIEIRVTDPPPADVIHAFVTLTSIEVHREGGGWETLDIEEATFDLMDLVGGVEEILGSTDVAVGSFTQIRMDVTEVEVVFVTDSTTNPVTTDTVVAEVPSDKLRIVKAFEVVGGVKTVLTLDFDGEKSLVLPGKDIETGKERALFKPVVRLLVGDDDEASATTGTGTDDDLVDDGDDDGDDGDDGDDDADDDADDDVDDDADDDADDDGDDDGDEEDEE